MRYDAIILTGGHGSRLGGVDKAQVTLAGAPLVERPLAACRDAGRVVVVGPHLSQLRPADRVTVTREDPPGGGPAAGTGAGVAALTAGSAAPWVLLLSCDLPMAEAGVPRLLAAARPLMTAKRSETPQDDDAGVPDGYCLTDAEGRLQWLFAIYRREALELAVRRCEPLSGTSMRRLLSGLQLVGVPDTADISGDLDTWDDHAAWTARLERDR